MPELPEVETIVRQLRNKILNKVISSVEILDHRVVNLKTKEAISHKIINVSRRAKSIIIEAAELLENYKWGPEYADMQNVKEEIADVLIYSIAFAYDQGFNIEEIILEKLKKNSIKYP